LLDSVETPDAAGVRLLTDAADAMRLTARGYRVLRVARPLSILPPSSASDACISPKRWPIGGPSMQDESFCFPVAPFGSCYCRTARQQRLPRRTSNHESAAALLAHAAFRV
jgi:hypothetical protein